MPQQSPTLQVDAYHGDGNASADCRPCERGRVHNVRVSGELDLPQTAFDRARKALTALGRAEDHPRSAAEIMDGWAQPLFESGVVREKGDGPVDARRRSVKRMLDLSWLRSSSFRFLD